MKILRVFLGLVSVKVCVVSQMTCNRILYCLSQAYKVYVTIAGTDQAAPLGSEARWYRFKKIKFN